MCDRSRQSSGNNTLEITKVKCKLCSTEVTKHFFRQHLTSAHFIDKWQVSLNFNLTFIDFAFPVMSTV